MNPTASQQPDSRPDGDLDYDNDDVFGDDIVTDVHDDDAAAVADLDADDDSDSEILDASEADIAEWHTWISWGIVAISMIIVWITVNPPLIFASDLTPTGGDMGAHVWGPRFLSEELIPQFRLSGWTQDWYAGFPAYVFYMVVPSLLIVWLAVRMPLWLLIPSAVVLGGAVWWSWQRWSARWQRRTIVGVSIALALLIIPVPYNVAFKLVAVSGMVTLPLAVFALGKASKAAFPIPAIMSVASLFFLFDSGFTILGGNGFSTMAGEFAFSLGLTSAVTYLAVLFHGIETGRHRALGAVMLALTLLMHPIPAIFAAVATAILFFVRRTDETPWWGSKLGRYAAWGILGILAWTLISGGRLNAPWFIPSFLSSRWPFVQPAEWLNEQWLFPSLATLAALVFFTDFEPRIRSWWRTQGGQYIAAALTVILGLGALAVFFGGNRWGGVLIGLVAGYVLFGRIDYRLLTWQLTVAPVALLLTGFWLLPFIGNTTHMNDMGWEKYIAYSDHLLAVSSLDLGGMPYRNIVFLFAGLGAILSYRERQRIGYFCVLGIVAFAWIFRFFPQYRLWNARLLPFYYFCIYLLAAVGVALTVIVIARAVANWQPERFHEHQVRFVGVGLVTFVLLFTVLGSIKLLPGGTLQPIPDSKHSQFAWGPFRFPASHIRDWAQWNFEGMERKASYPEFERLIAIMDEIGQEHGCGRAMWEFESDMNRWGTPMALMLLPHFTDGCIGSMEGLYFEASSTTPFHFLNQAELSVAPSSAQRDLPYSGFNMYQGVSHMQLMGIQYYMATSDQAITAASQDPRLTELHRESIANPERPGEFREWAIFGVSHTDVVVPLENEPVVITDTDGHIDGWVYDSELPEVVDGRPVEAKKPGPAVLWYNDPSRWDVYLAVDGPETWERRLSTEVDLPRATLPEVNVTNIEVRQDSLSFDVDQVGVPVLVKVSYFPNWNVSGGDGPWRVTPNYMVVIPTENTVELSYGRTLVDIGGWVATVIGLVGFGVLIYLDRRRAEDTDDPIEAEGSPTTSPEQPTENPQHNPQVEVEGLPGSQ